VTRFDEGPSASPGFLLWHLTLAWQRAITAVLAPFDLTHVQFVLLACTWWLREQGQMPNQLELARQAGTDVRMTSEVVRKLERKGLLTRKVDTADTRARRLQTTVAGTRLAQEAVTAVEEVDARLFDADSETLTPLLRRLLVSAARY